MVDVSGQVFSDKAARLLGAALGALLSLGCGSVTMASLDGAAAAAGTTGAAGAVADVGPELAPIVEPARDGAAPDVATAKDALPPVNLITNGDFSQGELYWHATGGGVAAATVVDGRYCTVLTPGMPAYVGWPKDSVNATPLAAGAQLRFSFDVSTTAALSTFNAQVGHAKFPITIDFQSDDVAPVGAPGALVHFFTVPAGGDSAAGVVFTVQAPAAATVCLDNVFLGPA